MSGDDNPNRRDISILEARNVGRRMANQGTWLIRHVSLTVRAGECVLLFGPTGSGKSVLLRALAALDALDEGGVSWHNAPIKPESTPHFRGKVMYVPQRAAAFPGSVRDNLRRGFELKQHASKRYDEPEAIRWLHELSRSNDFLDKPQRELSGGERQLVALVRALLLDPELLLLDEPTAALDAESTRCVERLLTDWYKTNAADQPRAIVWVSHDPGQQTSVGTRRVNMLDGPWESSS